jgi:hypothetical protein
MTGERRTLDFGDLDEFAPRPKAQHPTQVIERKAIDQHSTFPSRERAEDTQINIKASADVLNRFRLLAKSERYKHGDFLKILMDAYAAHRE